MANPDRLSGLDASFLSLERNGAHMHVGSVLVFEGDAPAYEDLVAAIERREGELLAVAGDQMQARVELCDEVVVLGRLALEEHAGAHVHVRARVLEREEGGVEAGEAVWVGHRGRLSLI